MAYVRKKWKKFKAKVTKSGNQKKSAHDESDGGGGYSKTLLGDRNPDSLKDRNNEFKSDQNMNQNGMSTYLQQQKSTTSEEYPVFSESEKYPALSESKDLRQNWKGGRAHYDSRENSVPENEYGDGSLAWKAKEKEIKEYNTEKEIRRESLYMRHDHTSTESKRRAVHSAPASSSAAAEARRRTRKRASTWTLGTVLEHEATKDYNEIKKNRALSDHWRYSQYDVNASRKFLNERFGGADPVQNIGGDESADDDTESSHDDRSVASINSKEIKRLSDELGNLSKKFDQFVTVIGQTLPTDPENNLNGSNPRRATSMSNLPAPGRNLSTASSNEPSSNLLSTLSTSLSALRNYITGNDNQINGDGVPADRPSPDTQDNGRGTEPAAWTKPLRKAWSSLQNIAQMAADKLDTLNING